MDLRKHISDGGGEGQELETLNSIMVPVSNRLGAGPGTASPSILPYSSGHIKRILGRVKVSRYCPRVNFASFFILVGAHTPWRQQASTACHLSSEKWLTHPSYLHNILFFVVQVTWEV